MPSRDIASSERIGRSWLLSVHSLVCCTHSSGVSVYHSEWDAGGRSGRLLSISRCAYSAALNPRLVASCCKCSLCSAVNSRGIVITAASQSQIESVPAFYKQIYLSLPVNGPYTGPVRSLLYHKGTAQGYSPILRTLRKASCGISMLPTCFIRFLPSFCFSSSLRLRVMSPP